MLKGHLTRRRVLDCGQALSESLYSQPQELLWIEQKPKVHAETRDRTGDLQIFSLTLSQLSYRGSGIMEILQCPCSQQTAYGLMRKNKNM